MMDGNLDKIWADDTVLGSTSRIFNLHARLTAFRAQLTRESRTPYMEASAASVFLDDWFLEASSSSTALLVCATLASMMTNDSDALEDILSINA